MEPYYRDNLVWWYNKDCRDMSELPDESVQMVCTSPPFWGLRRYAGLPDLVWCEVNTCKHKWGAQIIRRDRGKAINSDIVRQPREMAGTTTPQGNFCSLCGVWKGSYGLEPTPEMYIQHTIEILREIKRVLRKDGVVFWNIGDSYAGSGSPGGDFRDGKGGDEYLRPYNRKGGILKPKDLCLIPFRVAIAAQEAGWWIRSVIIWSKNNPMPESVTDRPTESHEYILMLTKSSRYYFDQDAVREPSHPETWGVTKSGDYFGQATKDYASAGAQNPADIKRRIGAKVRGMKTKGQVELGGQEQHHGQDIDYHPAGRNIRTVWEFPTQPFSGWEGYNYDRADFMVDGIPYTINSKCPVHGEEEHRAKSISDFIDTSMVCTCRPAEISHFAVFPEKLPELCIKAATPEVGCCSKCGAPWQRIVGGKPSQFNIRVRDAKAGRATPEEGYKATQEEIDGYPGNHPDPGYRQTLGWHPTCSCNAPKIPSIVLDPFLGVGTTLWVAKKLGRRGVGYELSEEYCALSLERNRQMVMELTS